MDTGTLLTGGGIGGFLLALYYVGRLILEWRTKNREDPRADRTTAVADAAATNAILRSSMEELRTENSRMAKKIAHLEREAEIKDQKIDELEARLNEIASELAALKSR